MILLTTKEFLEQVYFLDLEIRTKKEEIAKIKVLIEDSNKQVVGGEIALTRGLSDVVEEYNDTLIKDITRLVYLKHSIITRINEVEDSRSRVLLKLRYIDLLTIEEIAEAMEYSVRQVQRLHSSILKNMDLN